MLAMAFQTLVCKWKKISDQTIYSEWKLQMPSDTDWGFESECVSFGGIILKIRVFHFITLWSLIQAFSKLDPVT